MPEPGNPQALNRYAYVLGNPLRYADPTGHYVYEEDPSDPWIYSDPRVRSQHYYTHPEYEQGQPSDAEIIGTLLAVPVVATAGALVPEVGGAAWTVAQTGWTWLAETLGFACADGDCTNEVRGAGQQLIDDITQNELANVQLTHPPTYDSKMPLDIYGVATRNVSTRIGPLAIDQGRRETLVTIVHEEMHHRLWTRGVPQSESYVEAVAQRFARMIGVMR